MSDAEKGATAGAPAAEPAQPAPGNPVLLGEANHATTTTSISTSSGDALDGLTTADYQAGVAGYDLSDGGGHGVFGESGNGTGVYGLAFGDGQSGVYGEGSYGVSGQGDTGVVGQGETGVYGQSDNGTGVYGQSGNGTGAYVHGFDEGIGVQGFADNGVGVFGVTIGDGREGVSGYDASAGGGYGVYGQSGNGTGVYGTTTGGGQSGVSGYDASAGGYGVSGQSGNGIAVYGQSDNGTGVLGTTTGDGQFGAYGYDASAGGGSGVSGQSVNGTGVYGNTTGDGQFGVNGYDDSAGGGYGVYGQSANGTGVYAVSAGTALFAAGNAEVTGALTKSGGGFRIDHPLDPAGKYLYHSFVESPDMKNVYDGTTVLDGQGRAEVVLPDWFEALNRDFRYQLTALDAPAPGLHIASRIDGGRFAIAGGQAGQQVCWQVTGVRQDAWASAHRIPVDVAKPDTDRGRYLHPDLYPGGEPVTELARATRPWPRPRIPARTKANRSPHKTSPAALRKPPASRPSRPARPPDRPA